MKPGTSLKEHEVVIKGITFRSQAKACKHFKMDVGTVRTRIRKGATLEQALGLEALKRVPKVIVRGKEFYSMFDVCAFYNKERTTVKKRLNKGWTIEQALELEKRQNSSTCKGKVYIVQNRVNKKKYIGITTGSLEERFRQHTYDALTRGSKRKLSKAIRKYGVENFTIKLLKNVTDRYKLRKYEMYYIKKYNSVEKGYNISVGGCHLGDNHGVCVVYEGIEFNSIKAFSLHIGKSYPTASKIVRENPTMRKNSPALVR